MKTTNQALEDGFELVHVKPGDGLGYRRFKFGDGYELCFEPLLFDGQMYVALYKDQQLLTDKVVVKAGKVDAMAQQAPEGESPAEAPGK